LQILRDKLLPWIRFGRRIPFVYQQDNASIHKSRETSAWFASEGINILPWPACSPDLNPMENLWGIIVRRLYAENRQFATVDDLKNAIEEAWNGTEFEVLEHLVESMKNRVFQVIQRSGHVTDY